MEVNYSIYSLGSFYHCTDTAGSLISFAYVLTHVLLVLPLSVLVFYLGVRRWRQQRSFATTSHSDMFTYHSAAMELIFELGFALNVCERYLAIVHPIVYLRLRQSGGVRIRNISIGFAWLLYCGWIGRLRSLCPDSSRAGGNWWEQGADSTVGNFISVSFTITNLFLHLPLSLFVLYLGVQRWRQQRSFATTSHSDVFTYHSAAMQLIFALGGAFYICGKYTNLSELIKFWYYATCNIVPGQMFFHILTCVERYLAVVHPIIYLGLRHISVLCVLIRPGPGELGVGLLNGFGLDSSNRLSYTDGCAALMFVDWLTLPSSLTSTTTQTNMSINSSSSPLNDFHYCMDTIAGASIITAYLITKVFLFLPVSVLVLYLGFRRWRKQRSFITTSHSDIFTYNSVAHELIYLLERYLAVTQPIIYLGLKQLGGVRIRNISIGLSVLYVLLNPGPGEMGKGRQKTDLQQ
ncbi:hypothetical protein Q8A73_012656 [Channa argus]|nr:hypothetical protein Q8A73_012656 [Channa argus]